MTEITGLAAGTYYIHYGATKQYYGESAYNYASVTIGLASETMPIQNHIADATVSASAATIGERIDFKIKVGPDQWVQRVECNQLYGVNTATTITCYSTGYVVEEGARYYTGYFRMPSAYNAMRGVELKDVLYYDAKYYRVSTAEEKVLLTATADEANKVYVDHDTLYRENTSVKIAAAVNPSMGTYVLKGFKVYDADGQLVAESTNGDPVSTAIASDLTVKDFALEVVPLVFTALDEQVQRLEALDLSQYTYATTYVLEVDREKITAMYRLTKKDQQLLDDFVATLKAHIDALEHLADYSAVTAATDKAAALNKDNYEDFSAVDAALGAVAEGYGVSQQEAVNAMAQAIEDAITALQLKPADYAAVDAAIKKANELDSTIYKNFSAVEDAVRAVVTGKGVDEQEAVDAMAQAIEDAIIALKLKPADYTAVNAAIKKANELNPAAYKDFSAVEAAVRAVVTGKDIDEQEAVDAMAQAIEDAISKLEKKPAVTIPQTGIRSTAWCWVLLVAAAALISLSVSRGRKRSFTD